MNTKPDDAKAEDEPPDVDELLAPSQPSLKHRLIAFLFGLLVFLGSLYIAISAALRLF
jgi:hypothetical protein